MGKVNIAQQPGLKNVKVLDHPLAGTCLRGLRDKSSTPEQFRLQAGRLGYMLALEISKDLETKAEEFETPICKTTEQVVSERIGFVPILRAGIGLVEPFLNFMPAAHVLFLGMYRNEETHEPVPYYNKLREYEMVDVAYILDPMLATGGSAVYAIEALKDWGVKKIKYAGLIGAPEGVEAIHSRFPEIDIYLAALDDRLNENAYIVPGLGDAGDRIFNTQG